MTITVLALHEAMRDKDDFDFIISLLDWDWRNKFEPFSPDQKIWFFDDIVGPEYLFKEPTEEDVLEIIKTFEEHEDKNVCVHCYAGISRSSATAIGLKIFSGMSIKEAFETTFAQRPIMWPNDLILTHFDNIFNLKGELVKFGKDWKKRQPKLIV